MLKRLLILTLMAAYLPAAKAQVTTSSISGVVRIDGEQAPGATVTATDTRSGSKYRTVANTNGHYLLEGLHVGGPYEVTISYIGCQTRSFAGVQLVLGQNSVINADLTEVVGQMNEVVVTASAESNMRSDRAGAVTHLNASQMAAVPTIERTMADVMKMTPQSSSASGLAIGGGNYRQSAITVDGASFNNTFGLDVSPLPGGDKPISLEALEQLTVSLSPFDVRQSGFNGASVNAVTKSGTNTFSGAAYTYLTSTSLQGNRLGNAVLPVESGHTNTYGLYLGGPIVRDKLFFFVNAEVEDNVTAGPGAQAGDGSTPYTLTNRRPQASELQGLTDYMNTTYGLRTGPWQDFNVRTPAYRLLARIDWNINDNHKLNLRLTHSNRKNSAAASSSRAIGSNRASIIYGGSQASYGSDTDYGMSSLSSRYYSEYRFTSLTAELNSRFGKLNNTLRLTASLQDQPRSSEYDEEAPVVEIVMSDGSGHYPTWALMGDPFTYGNMVKTKNTVVTDELHAMVGNHSLFGGLQFEHTSAENAYAQAAAGYFAFEATPEQVAARRWDEVFTPANTRLFGITYGNNDAHSMFTSQIATNQLSLYAQDNWSVNQRLRLAFGARLELPTYPDMKDNYNADFHELDFGGRHFSTDQLPRASLSFSPRVGFNWDATGDRTLVLRGGTGLFVGRVPFVWLVSAVANSGVGQTSYIASQTKGTIPTFSVDRSDMLRQINATSRTTTPGSPTIISDKLRMPRTWKTSLAIDAKLPAGIDLSLEGIYSRDINPVVVSNADIYWDGTSTIDLGHGDVRHLLSYYDASHAPYILENAGSRAYYVSVSAQARKSFAFGLDLAASYTWSKAKSYTEGIGRQVASAYNSYRHSVNAVNDNELGYATYVAPNRLLLSASYKLQESKHTSSTFSLVYDAYEHGFLGEYGFSRYSYTFATGINGDPLAPGNLIYIPASRQELDTWEFAETTYGQDKKPYTPDMQRDDFWTYICQDDYLKNHKGEYAKRGGAHMPWHHQLDFRYMRDINLSSGKTRHTLQLGLDIQNLPNLLCKDWGLYKEVKENALLTYSKGKYTYNTVNGERHLTTYQTMLNTTMAYKIMFTIRYLFN